MSLEPYWQSRKRKLSIYHGDCLKILPKLDRQFDTIITDPPYGLSFMGKAWDHGVPGVPFWKAALKVVKPGGFLLAFGGTRTFHRLTCAIEDAGWEIRDTISYLHDGIPLVHPLLYCYGSGFPKSLDVSKAIDKAAGMEREVIGMKADPRYLSPRRNSPAHMDRARGIEGGHGPDSPAAQITAPATDAAKLWDGWGTSLKPAVELICVAMKPLDRTPWLIDLTPELVDAWEAKRGAHA